MYGHKNGLIKTNGDRTMEFSNTMRATTLKRSPNIKILEDAENEVLYEKTRRWLTACVSWSRSLENLIWIGKRTSPARSIQITKNFSCFSIALIPCLWYD